MNNEIVICVAPVPGEKQEEKFPGPLDVPAEIIACEAAGAAIAHLHARDRNLLQTVVTDVFAADLRKVCGFYSTKSGLFNLKPGRPGLAARGYIL